MSRFLDLSRTLAGLLRWWGSQLAAMLPARLRIRIGRAPTVLALTPIAPDLWQPTLHRPGQPPETLAATADTALPALAATLRAAQRQPLHLALAMPEALTRRVVLPIGAAGQLSEVLALDLDRQTPFRSDQACFAWHEIGRDTAVGSLTVALTVAPRAALLAAGERAQRLGLTLIHAAPEATPPWDTALTRAAGLGAAPRGTLLPALGTMIGAGVLAALLLPGWQAGQRISATEAEVAALRPLLEAARHAAATSQAASVPPPVAGPAAVAVLAEMARALPDQAVLRRLVLRDGRLEILGTAPGAADLVVVLAQRPRLAQVEFRAPVVAAEGGREQFHLSVALRTSATGAAAPP
jgi:general secretion pathway protein L